MGRTMYFGTRGFMQPIPTPAFNQDFSKSGWSSGTKYLNGRAGVRTSTAGHMVYNLSWNLKSRDEVRAVTDFADGLYGDGLIYFIDPMTADKNVLPMHWAFPALSAVDGPLLLNRKRPSTVPTSSNGLRYPARSMQFSLVGATDLASVYIPIPPGMVAWVGVHGSANGVGGVRVTPFTRQDAAGTPVYPTFLSVADPTRVNTQFSSAQWGGIELSLGAPAGAGAATNGVLSGLMVQVLRAGQIPKTGEFISGQGHSGCKFETKPKTSAYSAARDLAGMSAKLIEVGD